MLELVVRLVGSLAVVIGLLLLITKIGSRRFQGRKDAPLRVVQTQSLGRSTGVSVVEVYGRVLVLGTSDTQVNVLAELSPDVLEQAEEAATPAPARLGAVRPARAPRPQYEPQSEPVFQQAVFASAVVATPLRAPASPVDQALADLDQDLPPEPSPSAVAPTSVPSEPTVAEVVQEQQSLADLLLEDFGSAGDEAGWRRDVTRGVPRDQGSGPLAGSVLSASTWRQAMAVAWGRS